MATATTTRKPRPAPVRKVEVVIRPEDDAPGAVTIAIGKKESTYLVTRLPSDFGRAYRVEKLDDSGTAYDVLLHGKQSTCECKGFLHHGRCKHILTLAEMILAGLL
jgi:SWIM zinc finger